MKIEVKITKDVLRRSIMCGVPGYTKPPIKSCAIAVAIRDLFPCAEVSTIVVHLDPEILFSVVALPTEASLFIKEFDSFSIDYIKRLKLPEFSFEIEVPDHVIDAIGIEQAKAVLKKSETLILIEA